MYINYMKSIALFCLCLFNIGITLSAQEINLKKWMSSLNDTIPFAHLSIPSTHDSGATLGGFSLKTQDCSIKEQLCHGVRGFDIRLIARPEGKLGVYHDIFYQKITWEDDVLPAFIEFLTQNPSETLWVSLKKEGGDTNAYSKLLSSSLQNPDYDEYILKHISATSTLGECRGKIVFSHRDTYLKKFPGVQCHEWPDNKTGAMTFRTQDGTIIKGVVEDEYFYENLQKAIYKADITWKNMKNAMNRITDDQTWMISFASATALPKAGPKDFAQVVNPYLVEKTKSLDKPCGFVLVDFSGTPEAKELIRNLILSNLNYYLNN